MVCCVCVTKNMLQFNNLDQWFVLHRIKHENIVALEDIYESPDHLYLIMQLWVEVFLFPPLPSDSELHADILHSTHKVQVPCLKEHHSTWEINLCKISSVGLEGTFQSLKVIMVINWRAHFIFIPVSFLCMFPPLLKTGCWDEQGC